MELSLKSKIIKRKPKKKKIRIPDNVLLPVIKPDSFDGVSNWSRLLKIMGSSKEDKMKEIDTSKTNHYYESHDKPFSDKATIEKKSTESHQNVKMDMKCDTQALIDECLNKQSANEVDHLKTASERHKNESHNVYSSPKKISGTDKRNKFSDKNVHNSPKKISDNDKRNKYSEKRLTKAVAMDCEMVGVGSKGEASIIARVSIVNAYGICLYDEFVKPKEKVTDYRTKISGVRPSDLKRGKDLFEVQKDVLNIIEGRILVGHSIKYDLDVLFISHPHHLIRDTSLYKPFREICCGKTPSLKKLTSRILGCEIQSGEHSSVEDAQATMLLYLRQKKDWEASIRAQRKRKPRVFVNQTKN